MTSTPLTPVRRGCFLLLFVIAACIAAAGLWWHSGRRGIATSDAIFQPGSLPASVPNAEQPSSTGSQLAEAEIEKKILGESLESARKAIEEAVVMVQEQKENFDFAQDRYEKLMPLVETGALEPLAASQIQSAYISARAGLAQAKFLLAQARRAFGSEESRGWRLEQARRRVESLKTRLASEHSAAEKEKEDAALLPVQPPPPFVEAFFPAESARPLEPGMQAVVSFPHAGLQEFPAQIVAVEDAQWPEGRQAKRVILLPKEPPPPSSLRSAIPCKVSVLPSPKS